MSKFNLVISNINKLLESDELIALKKELDLFPERKRIGQDLLQSGYEFGLRYFKDDNKIKSRLGFIGEIGFPLYRAVSCIRQRLDKESILIVNTEVDDLCLDKTNVKSIMDGDQKPRFLKLNVGQSNYANYHIPHKDALGIQQMMGVQKYTISQYVYEAIQRASDFYIEALKKNTNSLYYLGQVLRMISLATINPHIIRNTQTESTELQLQESDLIPSIDTESDLEHVIIELKKPEYSKALYNIFYNPDVINYFNDLFMIDYKPLFEGFILSKLGLPKTFLGEKYIKTKKRKLINFMNYLF